jgi:hypothetical protein
MIDQNVETTWNVHSVCHGIGYGHQDHLPCKFTEELITYGHPGTQEPFQIPHGKVLDLIGFDGIQKGKRKPSKESPSCTPKDGGILSQKEPPKHLTLLELSAPCDTLT